MKDKEAIQILLSLIKKYPLTEEEKKSISTAVGVLSWTTLSEGSIRNKKKKMAEKQIEDLS